MPELFRTLFFSRKTFKVLLLAVLSTASLGAVIPGIHATQSTSSNPQHTPPLSGIFQSTSEFSNDSAGVGTTAMSACTDGTNLSPSGQLPNVRINCDSTIFPHNEVSIAVDPKDPNHIVAGSNDYELFFEGGFIVERLEAGYYTSFDHGTSWINGHVNPDGFTFNGDPAVAFNMKMGLVHYGTINFNGGQAGGFADASILLSTSSDGGKTFGHPVIVALGMGGTRVTVFNDKPYIAVDNNPTSPHYGRLYVTYTRFLFDQFGNYLQSPIFLSFSDDGGQTFSTPQQISGSSSTLCSQPFVPANAGICNEDQFSSPVVGPDGTLYVGFENQEHAQLAGQFRNQYLVVVSTDGGVSFMPPISAVFPIYDGSNDYPININGRQTLTNNAFRVNSAGNLAVDPGSGAFPNTKLYIAFSDNRIGILNRISPIVVTDTTVFVVASANSGGTWTSPVAVTGTAPHNDQFYPWAAVGNNGALAVAFSDKTYDPNDIQYGETLTTSTDHGSSFMAARLDTALSNPDDSRWFTAGGATKGKATFIGDYNGLAVGSDGAVHALWTDMRTDGCAPQSIPCWPSPPTGRGHNSQEVITADPGLTSIGLSSAALAFQGATVMVTSSFEVNPTSQTLTGTVHVQVLNSTTGAQIAFLNFTINLAFGSSLAAKLILAVPEGSLMLGVTCNVSITSLTTTCSVSRNPDIDRDGLVSITDLATVAISYGATIGSPNYNPAADLDADGKVDILDLAFVALDYGATVLY
jgi:hypothetical protein